MKTFFFLCILFYCICLNAQTTGTYTDPRDGKVYKTVMINNHIWLAENLNFYLYDSKCYNNSNSNCSTYGRLYWFKEAEKACPPGWHLPNDDEWSKLINHLGGEEVAGGKMKSTGFRHWLSPNAGASNESGFNALPGGNFYIGAYNFDPYDENFQGEFEGLSNGATFWSSTYSKKWKLNHYIHLSSNSSAVKIQKIESVSEGYMFSIRCIK